MTKYLANENLPIEAVQAARQAGYDVTWIAEMSPGVDDNTVLATALADDRVLLTCDKDFGEMAFRKGKAATCGIILLRPRVRSRATSEYPPAESGPTLLSSEVPAPRGRAAPR